MKLLIKIFGIVFIIESVSIIILSTMIIARDYRLASSGFILLLIGTLAGIMGINLFKEK